MEFTLTERTEPLTLKEVLDFIDDTNISKKDAHELKSRIVDVVLDSEDRVIDEFAEMVEIEILTMLTSEQEYRIAKKSLDEIAKQMKGE